MKKLKQVLYFPLAHYFRFFAQIQLFLWKPRVIVITGSNGKTTTLHLIESQLGIRAKYSHHANSAYGIPFNILGLERKDLTYFEWPYLFLAAPLQAFKTPPKEKIYVVEADCDREYEGKFLANLLNPEVVIWLSSSTTHSINFKQPVKESIAFEFGYFIQKAKKLVIVNSDSKLISDQLKRAKAFVANVKKNSHLNKYNISEKGTEFVIKTAKISFKYLLPEESFYSLAATFALLKYLDIDPDISFSKFSLPPGRSSVFDGIKNITIIDSSYNATPYSMQVILEMFKRYPSETKWLVLGDMIELGEQEKAEHKKLAKTIDSVKAKKIILVGPRLSRHTYPKLKSSGVVKFDGPKEALDYIQSNLNEGEVILFKGARFLEGVIEHLLKYKGDINKLCRREKVWQKRRKKWGL